MIGVFDSGVGGLCAYRELRRLLPREDMIYLADGRNAPYGTKSKEEILSLTKNNIRILKNMGADRVLIACCSASSLYPMLTEDEQGIATPIITPTAVIAAREGKRIAVIATDHTIGVRAFGREIEGLCDAALCEMAEQRLVALVEGGCRDGRLDPECKELLSDIAERVRGFAADTLILGCTHFSHLEASLSAMLPEVRVISPARVGAQAMARKSHTVTENGGKYTARAGRDIYINTNFLNLKTRTREGRL